MTTLHRQANWKIQIFGREHGIPHFYLLWPGHKVVMAIETGEVLAGVVSADFPAAALTWAAGHRAELMAEWKRLNPTL